MGANLEEPSILQAGDSNSQPSFQQPVDVNTTQVQGGPPPPAYGVSPGAPAIPLQPLLQHTQFQQPQFGQPQPQYQVVLQPDGTMQAIPVMHPIHAQPILHQQPIVMMSPAAQQLAPTKEPTIVVNNNNNSSASAAAASARGSELDACFAGCCGACTACLFCTVM